ncbi:MAG: hypothetical protein M3290_05435 [Actinomycetota bacterium]|nr:hypothetical protein [Actinomycetota bacterium]
MVGKGIATLAAALLVSMPACRIPGDTTTPGSNTTPSITSISVTQALASGAPATVSKVSITHKGETVLEETLSSPEDPASPPSPLQTGEIDPGAYTIKVADSACPPSGCDKVKPNPKNDCSVTVIVKKGEAVSATVHVNKRSCSIEVG